MGVLARKLLSINRGIEFVGAATDTKAGATSGNSTIALNSGLTGGTRSGVQNGDLVIAFFASWSTVDRTLSITDGTNPYTLIATELLGNDTTKTNLRVAYKFVSGDTDTRFGPTGATSDTGAMGVFVFSGVNSATPLDVAATTATGLNSPIADPPSITPSTAGAHIICIGAGAHSAGLQPYSSSDFDAFVSVQADLTRDISVGIGRKAWTSGKFNPAAYSWSGFNDPSYSWAAMSVALRPA